VQQGGDHIIFWAPSKSDKNSVFNLTSSGQIRGAGGRCILSEGMSKQLLFGDCVGAAAQGWAFDTVSGQLKHPSQAATSPLCAKWAPAPSPPPGPVGLELGVLIQGRWKLITGYPGWKPKWDGWISPPGFESEPAPRPAPPGDGDFCVEAPCLFDLDADPTEHNDVHAAHPDVVAKMMARLNELVKGEVTLKASGLCPTPLGSKSDQRSAVSARALGFWEPWLPPL